MANMGELPALPEGYYIKTHTYSYEEYIGIRVCIVRKRWFRLPPRVVLDSGPHYESADPFDIEGTERRVRTVCRHHARALIGKLMREKAAEDVSRSLNNE